MGEVIKKAKGGRFVGWYLRFVDVDGKRKQRASGQQTHAEAKRMLLEIEARIARGKLGVPEREPELAMMTIAELSERFLKEYDSPKIRSHDRWANKARTHLRPVLRQVGALVASQFSPPQAEKLRNVLIRSGAANTAAVRLSQISCVFAWATKQRIVAQNPFVGVRKPRKESRLEFLTVAEARRLIDFTDAQAKSDLRGAVFSVAVRLGLLAGLRAGEVFGLRWRDCDLDRGVMTVNKSYRSVTKTGKPRTVPMTDELVTVLRTWRLRCGRLRSGRRRSSCSTPGSWSPRSSRAANPPGSWCPLSTERPSGRRRRSSGPGRRSRRRTRCCDPWRACRNANGGSVPSSTSSGQRCIT